METTEKEYRQVREAAHQAYREAQKALEEQRSQINAQQHQLLKEFKQRMKALHNMYYLTTEHSINSHRKCEAYNIKRVLDKTIRQWESEYIDAEHAGIGFEMKEDCIQIGITISYKNKPVKENENQG